MAEEVIFDVDAELVSICEDIRKTGLSIETWTGLISDDGIQTDTYCGGFLSPEEQFWFSFWDQDGTEYWFQVKLGDIERIISGDITQITAMRAE